MKQKYENGFRNKNMHKCYWHIIINDIEYKNDITDSLNEVIKLIPKDCDGVLLGCTHFIGIKNEFRESLSIDVISQDELFISFYRREFWKCFQIKCFYNCLTNEQN